jgi:hypothetical protein
VDQCPYSSVVTAGLSADLDMVLRKVPDPLRPLPVEIHANLSSVDNHEVVEFVSELGGTYTVNVSAPTWSNCAAEGGARRTHLAIAWTSERYTPTKAP